MKENSCSYFCYRRGNEWPPKDSQYTPSTEGWIKLNKRRFHQMDYVQESSSKRYEAYMQCVYSALIVKNFTEYGWAVTKAPKGIVDKLQKRLHKGVADEKVRTESHNDCVETDNRPFFLKDDEMNTEILNALLPFHEAWSGVELIPNNAYGLRVYRNETNLNMHLDKRETHVISSILHVDHGLNDEPWPLVIEDFHGNTNEVILEPGDMLFYESSKLVHGRPTIMNGEYYSSLFSHYYPKNWAETLENIVLDTHYSIGGLDVWREAKEKIEGEDNIDELTFVGLSLKEPNCKDSWCGLQNSIKWDNISPNYGEIISGDGIVRKLHNIPPQEFFETESSAASTKDEL